MKIKIVIVVLALAAIGLGVAFFTTKKTAEDQHGKDVETIGVFSNQVVEADEHLKDLGQANIALTNDLASSRADSMDLSNSLATANSALADSKASLLGAQAQVTNLSVHITELEVQNQVLDEKAAELTNTIAELNALIVATQSKLNIAETNTAFLADELQNQMTQKAELEHKFNDVNEVRAQVKKLRDEMFVARRIQLGKNDNSGKKGAELLMSRNAANSAKLPPNYDLNVEVGSDGSVKVIPPLGNTNSPSR